MNKKGLTKSENEMLQLIRLALLQNKREGVDVSTWEATFLLKIIDRLRRQR